MQSEVRKIQFLRRLARVRAVEHKQALQQLAEARLQSDRLKELTDRTYWLAQENSFGSGKIAAEQLTAILRFRGRLSALGGRAERMRKEAESDADRAREHFAATERSCDMVGKRIAEDTKRIEISGASNLARNLLGELPTPRRSQS